MIRDAAADALIEFTPLNVLGHLTCFAPFKKTLHLSAQIPPQPVQVNTSAALLDANEQAAITVNISNPVRVRFPFGAIAAQLASDPELTLLCPFPEPLLNCELQHLTSGGHVQRAATSKESCPIL